MSFPAQGQVRVSRSRYWFAMLINVVVVTALLFGGAFAILSGSFAVGILMLLAMIAVGVYFRVVMMRRCRDIGWPPALPWILFGAGIFANFMNISSGGNPFAILTSFGLAGLVGLTDFVVMIIIGCIRSKAEHDYQAIFVGDTPNAAQRPSPAVAVPASASLGALDDHDDMHANWDAAIARALAKQATGGLLAEGAADRSQPQRASQPAVAPPPRAAGFGRKGL